jgi:hypothetical protein
MSLSRRRPELAVGAQRSLQVLGAQNQDSPNAWLNIRRGIVLV